MSTVKKRKRHAMPVFFWSESGNVAEIQHYGSVRADIKIGMFDRHPSKETRYHIDRIDRERVLLPPEYDHYRNTYTYLNNLPLTVGKMQLVSNDDTIDLGPLSNRELSKVIVSTNPYGNRGGERHATYSTVDDATNAVIRWYTRRFTMVEDDDEIRFALTGKEVE